MRAGKGTDGFEVGDEVQSGLSSGYSPTSWITLIAQVNFSYHGRDISADETEAAHTAMQSLYLSPGVTLRVSQAMILYGIYQQRVYAHSEEPTVIGNNHFLVGTTYSLRL